MLLTINGLDKSFDRGKVRALRGVSLQLAAGKTYSILGESGSGKTTLARLIAGLERPDRGQIHYQGNLISSESQHVPAEKRAIGYMFQHYALFPHLTIAQNIAYGLKRSPRGRTVVEEMLALVNLPDYGGRYPHELSGGQQQRVALARALAMKPRLLLLDEPFSNLDTSLRVDLRTEIFAILQTTGVCAVFITHNAEDAMAISDEVIVLKAGTLLQQASPQALYVRPARPYVARIFDALVELSAPLLAEFGYSAQAGRQYFLRSHHLSFASENDYRTAVTVHKSAFMGKYYEIEVAVAGQVFRVQSPAPAPEGTGELGWKESDLLVFGE
ncbi:MAG: ABC transporter ATP-binding protein [Bacteroidota bacterium]